MFTLVTHSLTHSLTDCCLVNLIDVTLACEDANSKLVEVVTVADIDAEKHVDGSRCGFGHALTTRFCLDFVIDAQVIFLS